MYVLCLVVQLYLCLYMLPFLAISEANKESIALVSKYIRLVK